MPAHIDEFDWGTTPLGPRDGWSPALQTSSQIMSGTGFAACAVWGAERTFLYNAAYIPFLGDKHPGALGQPIEKVWAEVWDDIRPLIETALGGEKIYLENLPLTILRNGAMEETYWTFSYSPLFEGPDVKGMLDIAIETTDRVRAEQHRQLLVREAGHRVKNTLSLVQAVARSSLRNVDPQGLADFEGRLMALARSHEALDEAAWSGGDLRDVISLALNHLSRRPFDVSGPSVALSSRVAQNVALIIHELTTNAFKYGALSVPDGRVDVHWTVSDGELALVWIERDGPPVTPPTSFGFGSKLVKRGLTGAGGVDLSYEAHGFSAVFTAPTGTLALE